MNINKKWEFDFPHGPASIMYVREDGTSYDFYEKRNGKIEEETKVKDEWKTQYLSWKEPCPGCGDEGVTEEAKPNLKINDVYPPFIPRSTYKTEIRSMIQMEEVEGITEGISWRWPDCEGVIEDQQLVMTFERFKKIIKSFNALYAKKATPGYIVAVDPEYIAGNGTNFVIFVKSSTEYPNAKQYLAKQYSIENYSLKYATIIEFILGEDEKNIYFEVVWQNPKFHSEKTGIYHHYNNIASIDCVGLSQEYIFLQGVFSDTPKSSTAVKGKDTELTVDEILQSIIDWAISWPGWKEE